MKSRTLASALMATCIAPLLMSSVSAQSLTLRMSSEDPPSSPLPVMARKFGEELKQRLPELEYEMFDTGALGDEVVHMQMIRTGQIQAYAMGSDAVSLDPSWAVFDMPFLFSNPERVYEVLDGPVGDALAESMREAVDLEVLSFGEIGFRQMTNSVRAIETPEDLDGVRIRVPGSQTRIMAFETLGASPVTMNFGELYLALQNGTVDGQENPLSLIDSQSFYEVQDYLSLSNHVYTPVTFVMYGPYYDELTEEQQQAVQEAAQAAAEYSRELGRKADEELVSKLGEEMEVNEIDTESFQSASRPIWDAIAEVAGQDITDRVIEAATAE